MFESVNALRAEVHAIQQGHEINALEHGYLTGPSYAPCMPRFWLDPEVLIVRSVGAGMHVKRLCSSSRMAKIIVIILAPGGGFFFG
jgi:hypothetical protein